MKGSPLRDRLLSNSPDPIKSSILRDSGMGWNSPPSSEPTSPLRIAKRDPSPSKPTQADLARRSSSSYRAMRSNNLVSKSPFKSQIPTPSTPSRNHPVPVLFPTRRVSGEKRPRPPSMHEQAEEENERPFALKRERKQSKTFQGLIEKEPVTKSPFRRLPFRQEDNPPRLPQDHPRQLPDPHSAQSSRIPTATTASTASPLRSSLVSKRMHGPRLSGGKRRERRKTVTFDERMDVMEFERDEFDEEALDDSEDDYGQDIDDDDEDPFFQSHTHQETTDQPDHDYDPGQPNPDDSYESIELSDSGAVEPGLQLDADTSINGLVEDLFAGRNPTSTPPRSSHNTLPADLETEDGVPLGRSHHRDRVLRFHQQQHSDSPARQSPISFNHPLSLPNTIHSNESSAPSTPPRHAPASSPPLGRSTHMERRMAARQDEHEIDKDVDMMPASPSPVKPRTPGQQYMLHNDPDGDGLMPKFDLSAAGVHDTPDRSHTSAAGPDPFALPNLKDEALPEGSSSFISMSASEKSFDDSFASAQNNSDVNLSVLEKKFGHTNERLLNTELEVSPMHNEHASFSQPAAQSSGHSSPVPASPSEPQTIATSEPQALAPAPVRRSPLPPIPAGVAPHIGSPLGSSPRGISPLAGRSSSPRLRPRISRDNVRMKMLGGRRFSSSPSQSPSPAPAPEVNGCAGDSLGILEKVREELNGGANQEEEVVDKGKAREVEQPENDEEAKRFSLEVGSTLDADGAASIMTGMTENSAEEATIETALVVGVAQHHHHPHQPDLEDEEGKDEVMSVHEEKELPIPSEEQQDLEMSGGEDEEEEDEDDDERQEEFGILKPPMIGTLGLSSSKLNFDFGSKFGLGGLGIDTGVDNDELPPPQPSYAQYQRTREVPESIASRTSGDSRHSKTSSTSSNMVRMGAAEEDVSMDMRSALDRLMEDVASVGGNEVSAMDVHDTSVATEATEDDDEPLDLRAARVKSQARAEVRVMERAATDSAVVINGRSMDRRGSDPSLAAPPPPLKDAIRAREALIIEKRREMRRMEEAEDNEYYSGGDIYVPARRGPAAGIGKGRPSRRRSMSTGDVHEQTAKLEVGSPVEEDPLEESIERELQKRDGPTKSQKYLIREREAIYASSDVSHMAGPGDVNAGKAWRTVRRPSDMNEYSKQIKEYRANQNPGKAYGKVFVKVMGVKNLHVPIPQEPTAMSCTLNNGIHFVTTPECRLSKEMVIAQEFELIEHSKLEFTLTLKVRRDPHIISQFKALAPPPPQPPPMMHHTSSKSSSKSGGMFSLFSSSPKKSKDKEKEKVLAAPPPPPPVHRLPENLARYMKSDGTFARAFISFKDIAHRCDTKIFETSFPLIGQRLEVGNKSSTMQVGEIVLQMFRLPPLPGIPPDELPQSLEECHRGLRHVNWHKVTYFEGTLTQSGGDCSSWRRRRLRVVGANLVAFNDVTKRVTATINLKNAIAVEDDQEGRTGMLSPSSGTTARSARHDEYDGLYGVERSFRLIFPGDEEICFFADTDEEKARWLEILRALVGHIPPHPLWAELLWQRQNDLNGRTNGASSAR